MSTYREVIYLILDEIKGFSDDFSYTEDHVLFIINKYRAFLLKQKYSNVKKNIPDNNFQTIKLPIEEVSTNCTEYETKEEFAKSEVKVPAIMNIAIPRVYNCNYMHENISFIPKDRMRFVGYNKYLNNILYCSIYPDNHLYIKSENAKSIEELYVTAVFQDPLKAIELQEEKEEVLIDNIIPIEESLIPNLVELAVKELLSSTYRPADPANNANDDLANIQSFIRNNMKSQFQKQLE